jgi:hypothetical protein
MLFILADVMRIATFQSAPPAPKGYISDAHKDRTQRRKWLKLAGLHL